MRRLRDLSINKLICPPSATVGEATALMERNGQVAVAVIEARALVGIVTYEACLLSSADTAVREVMRGLHGVVQDSDAVRDAARTMLEHRMDHLAVYHDQAFVGLVTSFMLLDELQYSWDPMTGLPWSDRLREWGSFHLALNSEISIVFFDIDDFGKYNKIHGHTVGDEVIKSLAVYLEARIDPARDVLVRYGGDEFAIASLRDRREAEKLLQSFEPMKLTVAGVPDPVWFSGGVSGGKRTEKPGRTQERESSHVASTLDNLINIASKQCTANKNARKARLAGQVSRVQLVRVADGRVVLALGEQEAFAEFVLDDLSSVASATARAFEQLTGDKVMVQDVVVHRDRTRHKVVSVVGQLVRAGVTSSFSGSHVAGADMAFAVAQAVFNGLQ